MYHLIKLLYYHTKTTGVKTCRCVDIVKTPTEIMGDCRDPTYSTVSDIITVICMEMDVMQDWPFTVETGFYKD